MSPGGKLFFFFMFRVVSPGFYTWQKFNISNNNPLPGSASAVAQHLLASILTQFGERRLFLYLFGYNHDTLKEAVFSGIAGSLEDMEGEVPADQTGGGDKEGEEQLCHTSPIKYFLEVQNLLCVQINLSFILKLIEI